MSRQGPSIAELSPEYCQGARCGHIEGKGRAGDYVIGEELELSEEAAANQSYYDMGQRDWWAAGYRRGYRLAAEGEPLPEIIERAPLPGASCNGGK